MLMINFNCCVSILHWIFRNVINTIHKFLVKVMAGNVFRLDKHWCWSIFSDLFFIFMSASNFARLLISFCFVIWVSFICKKNLFYVDCLIFILYKQKYHVIKRRIILVYLIIKHFYGLLNFCNFWNELLEWRIATSFIWWALVSNRKSTLSNLIYEYFLSTRNPKYD